MALLSILFVGRQVKQNAKQVVQQYTNTCINNEVDDILYFEDCAIFSLNTADAFCSQMRFLHPTCMPTGSEALLSQLFIRRSNTTSNILTMT